MSINKVEIQDSNGNVYYPHTDASVVKFGNTDVGSALSERVKQTTADINYYVNATSGSDTNDGLTSGTAFKTIQHAINSLPQVINHNVTIVLSSGTYPEYVNVNRFAGTGTIILLGGADIASASNYIVNTISSTGCMCNINVKGITASATTYVGFYFSQANYALLQYCRCEKTAGIEGIILSMTKATVDSCVISNKAMAIRAEYNSIVTSNSNSGSNNSYSLGAYTTATIGKSGAQPSGTTAEFTMNGGVIR